MYNGQNNVNFCETGMSAAVGRGGRNKGSLITWGLNGDLKKMIEQAMWLYVGRLFQAK